MLETLILGIASFIGTNLDDIWINMVLFAEADTKEDHRSIILGKYMGTMVLILLSVLGAWGLQILSPNILGYLGLIPIALGIKEIVEAVKDQKGDQGNDLKNDQECIQESALAKKASSKVWNAALITVASGADNIGVHIPLFASFALWQTVVTIGVFLVLTWVWCMLGKAMGSLPAIKAFLGKYKTFLVPLVYIALGIYICIQGM